MAREEAAARAHRFGKDRGASGYGADLGDVSGPEITIAYPGDILQSSQKQAAAP